MGSRRTADRNALTALLRSSDVGIDARRPLTDEQVVTIAAWRRRAADDAARRTIRDEAHRLAAAVVGLTDQLEKDSAALAMHVEALALGLQKVRGVGPVAGAILLPAYSHKGRVRSEAVFANLAGMAPLPASTGDTTRHRLNRREGQQLNRALDVIAKVRISCDWTTREYVTRRTAEGKTSREIRRSLKRYLARSLFRQLNTLIA
jgi:transposase